MNEYITDKVTSWGNEVATFALSQPQVCYAAFIFGLKHRWPYFLRTLPDIQDLLEPLEKAISNVLIPAITEKHCTEIERDILALPVRYGGLGMTNPCHEAKREYSSSVKVTTPLVEKIVSQTHELPDEEKIRSEQQCGRSLREKELKDTVDHVKKTIP